ncbi:endolytic transglycosylase MltG [Anaerovorax sp. IOR16]|uniref:endolytic transglycosylase MltG n=1 Tax=Anaerovorax sp. IOR16 TaxID=2773458 RepID=UPI0019D28CC1|nr:endolytic transglycosylase MltG [Anaerovorax sp. IOR16]
MNKLKDILYDKNDILVVLIILAIAALIISNRIDAIMAYPQIVLAQDEKENKEPVLVSDLTDSDDSNVSKENNKEPEKENPAEAPSDKSNNNAVSNETTAESAEVNYSVYIESGSTGSKIAQTLIDSGLIKDKNEFYDAVSAANAESKLKAGNFIIPEGSTPEQIVQILSK